MSSPPSIILASASPRRRELLALVGVPVAVIPADIDESVLPGETPEAHVIRLSEAKALAIARQPGTTGRWVIGSDTVVVRDTAILGKPVDRDDAAVMLRSLSGRAHEVVSGYAVHDRESARTISGAVVTRVWFKPLTDNEINGYIATGEPLDKAGAYAIQGTGAFMVPRIEGSYPNVVGLPLCEVIAALEEFGATALFS